MVRDQHNAETVAPIARLRAWLARPAVSGGIAIVLMYVTSAGGSALAVRAEVLLGLLLAIIRLDPGSEQHTMASGFGFTAASAGATSMLGSVLVISVGSLCAVALAPPHIAREIIALLACFSTLAWVLAIRCAPWRGGPDRLLMALPVLCWSAALLLAVLTCILLLRDGVPTPKTTFEWAAVAGCSALGLLAVVAVERRQAVARRSSLSEQLAAAGPEALGLAVANWDQNTDAAVRAYLTRMAKQAPPDAADLNPGVLQRMIGLVLARTREPAEDVRRQDDEWIGWALAVAGEGGNTIHAKYVDRIVDGCADNRIRSLAVEARDRIRLRERHR